LSVRDSVSNGRSSVQHQLSFLRRASSELMDLEKIANLANIMLFTLVKTDKIAVAVIEGRVLRSINTIGDRVFMDLSLDQRSVNARAIRNKKTQIVNNTRLDPDYFPGFGYDGVETLSELCVPIIYDSEVFGTINLESRRMANYSRRDAAVVEVFAEELAKIIYFKGQTGEGHEYFNGKIRSSHDMYIDVLAAVDSGEGVATRILNSVNISWKRGKEILDQLVDNGLLESRRISHRSRIYSVTE
jgi:putative methionine-R-sulfoxide reductase with GAF domain/predicted transcriptional regulator